MKIVVALDYEALSERVAGLVREAIESHGHRVLGLPTGRTPLGMYSRLDLSGVTAFGLDEYVGLATSDPRSFTSYLRRQVPAARLHMPPGDSGDYEREITRLGGIELLIAGIGANGHIAFNEPGAPFDSRTRIVDLAESTRSLLRGTFGDDEPPKQGVTMGIATILDARRIILLASGKSKAPALAAALHGPVTVDCPASVLRLHSDVTVIADMEAMVNTRE